jgi:hypothetical protein
VLALILKTISAEKLVAVASADLVLKMILVEKAVAASAGLAEKLIPVVAAAAAVLK